MEGERRKRKIENNEEEDEAAAENEEEKMEKFFSLIKRTKDVRDRLFNKDKSDKKIDGAVWNPTFQPEDFIDSGHILPKTNNIHHHDSGLDPSQKDHHLIEKKQDSQFEAVTTLAPASEYNEDKDKASEHHLDLNLSL